MIKAQPVSKLASFAERFYDALQEAYGIRSLINWRIATPGIKDAYMHAARASLAWMESEGQLTIAMPIIPTTEPEVWQLTPDRSGFLVYGNEETGWASPDECTFELKVGSAWIKGSGFYNVRYRMCQCFRAEEDSNIIIRLHAGMQVRNVREIEG